MIHFLLRGEGEISNYLLLCSLEGLMKSGNSHTLATSCEELTHWKRPWCWEGLGAGGEGDDTGWDGWMASPTGWTWVWVNSGSWWWTGRPGVLQSMGSQRVGHDWATELSWAGCCDHPVSSPSVSASDCAHWLVRPLSLSPLARGANLFGLGVTRPRGVLKAPLVVQST